MKTQALGERASQYAKQLAGGKPVELKFDQANAAQGHEGRYGRTLAYVWVLDESGSRQYMVNRRQMDPNLKRSIRNYVLEGLPESVTRRIRIAGAKPTLSGYDRWPYSARREFHACLV